MTYVNKTEQALKEKALERNMEEYARIDTLLTQMKKQLEEVRGNILSDLNDLQRKSDSTDYGTFSVREESTKVSIDRKKLESDYPNVFNKVKKISTVKETLQVRKK